MCVYFRYQFIHWYKFENDEVMGILYCTCTVLCNIFEYVYNGQIAKRRTSPVFAFNMQTQTDALLDPMVSERHVCIKVTSTGHLSSSHGSSSGSASGYISQGCRFTSHCGQEFFIFHCRFRRDLCRSTEPIQMKSSMSFIRGNRCIEGMIIWKKNFGDTTS